MNKQEFFQTLFAVLTAVSVHLVVTIRVKLLVSLQAGDKRRYVALTIMILLTLSIFFYIDLPTAVMAGCDSGCGVGNT